MAKSRSDYSAEFESVWDLYVRKAGKGGKRRAYAEFKKARLAADELESLKKAIPRYLVKTEDQFRQHFCKFLKDETWKEFDSGEPSKLQFDTLETEWANF